MRISLFLSVLLLSTITISKAQNSADPKTWLRTLENSAGDYFLTEYISGKILHRFSTDRISPLINFNPVMPVQGLDSILTTIRYLPKTMICVASSESGNEQTIWSLSDSADVLVVMTNKRVADLRNYHNMNFPQRSISQPLLSTYVHAYEEPQEDTGYILRLGNAGTGNLPVDPFVENIAEVILYDRVLSHEERNVIESYLAIKFGLTLNPMHAAQYVDARGNMLWDGLRNNEYHHRIGGVGRDDLTGLYQKQSSSSGEPGGMILSVGALAASNTENRASLPQGAFLVWGDNNAPMTLEEVSGVKHFFGRNWRMCASNWQELQVTNVIFERNMLKTFLNEHELYWLVIDRQGDDSFDHGNLEYYQGQTGSNIIEFEGVTWDADHSGMDAFTLMIAPGFFIDAQVKQPLCNTEHSGSLQIRPIGGTSPYRFVVQGPAGFSMQWTSDENSIRELEHIAPGNYSVTATDAGGLCHTEVLMVAHLEMAEYEIGRQYILPSEGQLLIDFSHLGFDAMQWILPDGQERAGQSLEVVTPGFYSVFGMKDGCVAAGRIEVKSNPENPFRTCIVYPNPTGTGVYQLRADLERIGDLEIFLYSAASHLIGHDLLPGRQNYIYQGRITGPPGNYIVTASAIDHSVSIPMIYR